MSIYIKQTKCSSASTYKRRYHMEYTVEVVPGESEAPIKSVLYYDDSSWVCQVEILTD